MAKILIADDVSLDQQIVSDIVKKIGHQVILASDGDQTLEIIRNERPDLLLLDVVMPKKNGFQVCREIRNDPSIAKVKIIMVTSKNQDADKFYGLQQGADDYLSKPINESTLVSMINKLIR
jgi:twitching motility two-component system response regulator PilH